MTAKTNRSRSFDYALKRSAQDDKPWGGCGPLLPVLVSFSALAKVDDQGVLLAGVEGGELVDGFFGEPIGGIVDSELEQKRAFGGLEGAYAIDEGG